MLLAKERKQIVEYGKKLITSNLTTGTGGNISIYNREKNLIAITPSGLDYFATEVEDVLVIDINGNIVEGNLKASSETLMHLSFYRAREDASAIVHTHSKYATAVACMGWKLPAVHYLVGMGGQEINCAKYAVYGSEELACNALAALGDNTAVLLANHGLICLGRDINEAFSTAEHLEFTAEIYCICKSMGEPNILTKDEMDEVMMKLGTYGAKKANN